MRYAKSLAALLLGGSLFSFGASAVPRASPVKLVPHRVSLTNGKSFELNLPSGFAINVAAQGLRRVRFMARSPDQRIFVTDMHDLTDNTRGAVYILDQFDPVAGRFKSIRAYLTGLRNPNSIAFYVDRDGVPWLYLALTDRLVRYKYRADEDTQSAKPEVLAAFPDYGLSYKYGGWHLTRTIAIGTNDKIYVSVGSSCNACVETEDVRASILEMDPDGKHQRRFAHGLRNAVGVRWIGNQLLVTDMGSDHLGDHRPADTMYAVRDGVDYGWPYCYQSGTARIADPRSNRGGVNLNCRQVPVAFAAFDAHSSPLGFEFFGGSSGRLKGSYLIALHGSAKTTLKRGYRVVRLQAGRKAADQPEDFITGFLAAGKVHGRPVDILRLGADRFLLTDDYAGVVYYVRPK